jgi:uncharacterized membrane protein YdjX (TVP38/TMEM64 family)
MDWIAPLVRQLADLGTWGPVLFILLYVAAAITLAPAFLLTFSAGAVFGLWRGTLLTFVGATLGASAVYGVAAPLARSRVLRWVDRDPRVAATRRAVVRDGAAWIMFLLRLSPLVPYNLLNYALALSGVRFRDYLVALVGMVPAIIMYAYYGKVAGDLTRIAAGVSPARGTEYYVMMVVGLIATVAATHLISRAAKKAIAEERGLRIDEP